MTRPLEVITGGSAFFAFFFAFSWLLDRACARFYGGLTGSQMVSHPRESAEWAALWAAVNGADGDWLPASLDSCMTGPRSEEETP